MKKEKELIEGIVLMMDAQLGERSYKARLLAGDIADCARDTGNAALARVFDEVGKAYCYD